MGQAPEHLEQAGDAQGVVQHGSLSLGKGSVAGVGVGHDGLGLVDQIGELLITLQQVFLVILRISFNSCDPRGGLSVVSVVVAQHFLAQEVDGIAEVGAPAILQDGVHLHVTDFLVEGGDVGADVQHDEVIAEAVGEALLQDGGGIQSIGIAALDVVVAVDRERDADGAQLVHGLLLQVRDIAVVGTQALHGLAVVSFAVQAHLLGHQSGVLLTLGVVADAGHGVEVVLALQGVDLVGAGVVVHQVQALVEALTESVIRHSLVPVLIQVAVLILTLEVQVHLVAELGGALLAQVCVVSVVGVAGDGGQVGLGQVDVVHFAGLIQLQADGQVADHLDGVVLKAGALVGSIVVGVGDEALGVALDELLHQVRTIVPHGGVIAGTEALHAQLLDQILGSGVEAVVGNHGVKVGAGAGAGEHQRVIIGSFHADTGSQHILVGHVSGSVALVLGQVVVIGSAHHSLGGHGGVESLVLESVQDPLKAHQEAKGKLSTSGK